VEGAEVASLVARVEGLERSNRHLRFAGAALVGVLTAIVLFGGASAIGQPTKAGGQVVSAQRFMLVASDGKARGVWEVTANGGAALEMYDSTGVQRIVMQVGPQSNPTSLAFLDHSRRDRVLIGESTRDEPVVLIRPTE
jgi:hypothetical protein